MEDLIYWVAIKKLPKVGDITFINYLQEYEKPKDIFENYNITEINKDEILRESAKEVENCKKLNVKIVTYQDNFYPENLKQIHSPPPILYCIGNLELLKSDNSVAVVGSRNPTDYGRNVTKDLVKLLVKYRIVIVSGFARGIDSIAHEEAINNKGSTIAVLGCGINIIYPAKNRLLFSKISNSGLIITEFSLDTKPEPKNFPKRNRIISGISKAIAVVEAGKKSGSLITADFALNQGKDIYAVPGNIYNFKAKGCNYLIKNGAFLLENGIDIIENSFPHLLTIKNEKLNIDLNSFSNSEKRVYELLKDKPLTFDELVISSSIPPHETMAILSSFEINGIVKKFEEKFFAVN